MKKILALLLVLVLVLSLFAGCGGSKKSKLVIYSPHDADSTRLPISWTCGSGSAALLLRSLP